MIVHPRHRWFLLGMLSAALFLIALDNAVLYTALPTLTDDLGATSAEKLWIINAYPLTMASLLLGAGTLGDKVGHVKLFTCGLVVFAVASLGAAFSPTAGSLIASRAFLGLGAAVMMPATLALIRLAFPIPRERNLAMGVWGAIALVGAACGPVVGGLLLQLWWWGSVFLLNVPVIAAVVVAVTVLRPRNIANPARRWDWASSIWTTAGLGAMVLCIKETANPERSLVLVVVSGGVSAVALSIFARRQKALEDPLVDLSVFRLPGMRAGVLGAVLVMFAMAGVQLIMSQRLQLVMGLTPFQAGLLLASVAVGALPFALLGGAVLHRTGPTVLVVGGLVITGVGALVTLVLLESSTSVTAACLVVVGVGIGLVFSACSTVIITSVRSSTAGMAASIEEIAYEMGSLVAVAVLGSVLAAVFTSSMVVPPGAEGAATSIDAAARLVDQRPEIAEALSLSVAQAFGSAAQVALGVVVVALLLGALAVLRDIRRFRPDPEAAGH